MAMRTVLPIGLTTFVGRERELSDGRNLLQRFRVVTMTGAGGSGKSRLAVELASECEDDFPEGVTFVELAPLRDPALIAPTIAQALGAAESTQRGAEETVLAILHSSALLLVLDNCEHLIDSCAAFVGRLLQATTGPRVLATSREPLDIAGEATLVVPPLSLPSIDPVGSVADVGLCDSVRLFVDRAEAANVRFVLDESNVSAVARVCHRLDGLPLALELAAARMRSLEPGEILDRLDNRFSLLKRSRSQDPRHQTLRATIDWSHEILSEPERVLFRRLSAFVGGWTLSDAESVCTDALLPPETILGVHSNLVDKSLVVAEPTPNRTTRYRFLETIGEYARERLNAVEESDEMSRRHFDHLLEVAERYDAERMTGGSDAGLPEVAAHRDNFRVALAYGVDRDPERCLRLAAALDDVWRMISAAEGWGWLQRTLPRAPKHGPVRVRALLAAGMLSAYVPAYAEGAGLLRQVLEEAGATGDAVSAAWAHLWLGRLAFFREDVVGAENELGRALAAHRELGNALGAVRALALFGLLEALVLGKLDDGKEKLEEAVGVAHGIGDEWGEGYAHLMLGICAADAADTNETIVHSRAALDVGSLGPILAVPLQSLARVHLETDPKRGVRLLGAAAGHLERTGTLEPAFVRVRAEAAYERAQALLGDADARRIFDEGRRMTTDDAIAFERAGSEPGLAGLTRREAQVAALVARGQTNREIAATLVLSVRTVESHVDHALTKLGLGNRTQLAAWVVSTEASNAADTR